MLPNSCPNVDTYLHWHKDFMTVFFCYFLVNIAYNYLDSISDNLTRKIYFIVLNLYLLLLPFSTRFVSEASNQIILLLHCLPNNYFPSLSFIANTKCVQSFNISIDFIYSTPCDNYGPCFGVTLKKYLFI